MSTITKPKTIPISAEQKQVEQRLEELQSADRAEAERLAAIAALLEKKQALDEARQQAMDEAEIKALLAEYTPAHQAIYDLKGKLLHDLHKLLSNYKSEVGDKVKNACRLEQSLMTLGHRPKALRDAIATGDCILAMASKNLPEIRPRTPKQNGKPVVQPKPSAPPMEPALSVKQKVERWIMGGNTIIDIPVR